MKKALVVIALLATSVAIGATLSGENAAIVGVSLMGCVSLFPHFAKQ